MVLGPDLLHERFFRDDLRLTDYPQDVLFWATNAAKAANESIQKPSKLSGRKNGTYDCSQDSNADDDRFTVDASSIGRGHLSDSLIAATFSPSARADDIGDKSQFFKS